MTSYTSRGRPGRWDRDFLLRIGSRMSLILERGTHGRVSLGTFIGRYLPILTFPEEIRNALTVGELNLHEASILASLTAKKLQVSESEASLARKQILKAHLQTRGSQNQLRTRVKEVIGETAIVNRDSLALAVQKADDLLSISDQDIRHVFFENIKELVLAIREFDADDLTENDIDEFLVSADIISNTIHTIKRRIKARNQPPKILTGFAKNPEENQFPPNTKPKVGSVKDPSTGQITFKCPK